MNIVDLTDGRWVPLDESKRTNLAVERTAERLIDMAEENVIVDESPEVELSDAALELVREVLAAADESDTADLSHDTTNDSDDEARGRAWLVEQWSAAEEGRPARSAVELATPPGAERERLLEAWARQSG